MVVACQEARRPTGSGEYPISTFEFIPRPPRRPRTDWTLETGCCKLSQHSVVLIFASDGKLPIRGDQMLDPRDFRLRHFLLIALVSVLVAAVLRHTLHVYGNISPKDIGVDALVSAAVIALAVICLRKRFWR
jgi:hypothetical protein